MNVAIIKRKITPILKRQGVLKAAIFGSYARGEEKKNSDVDILVKLKKGTSLLDLIGIQFDLEEKLGKKVDLITYNSINPLLRNYILSSEKVIYEKR